MQHPEKGGNDSLSIKIYLYAKIASLFIYHICDYVLEPCAVIPII